MNNLVQVTAHRLLPTALKKVHAKEIARVLRKKGGINLQKVD